MDLEERQELVDEVVAAMNELAVLLNCYTEHCVIPNFLGLVVDVSRSAEQPYTIRICVSSIDPELEKQYTSVQGFPVKFQVLNIGATSAHTSQFTPETA